MGLMATMLGRRGMRHQECAMRLMATVLVGAVAACGTSKGSDGGGADPWSAGAAERRKPASAERSAEKPADGGGWGGLGGDPMTLLKSIAENLSNPGPYDPPEHSPEFDAAEPHWGVMTLSGALTELASFSWTSGMSDAIPLRAAIQRLRALGDDDTLSGLLLRIDGVTGSLPDVAELRAAMADFRSKGKKLHCHVEGASNGGYVLLTGCERIALAPTGEIQLSGPAAMPVHLKGLLDELGIAADFLHVGAYKGAAEPLTREQPSKEMEETLAAILDRAYATMVEMVASGRGLEAAAVKGLIDEAVFPADRALSARLVDEVVPFETFRDATAGEQEWSEVKLAPEGGQLAGMMKMLRFLGAVPTPRPTEPHVALVYALGDVIDGEGEGSIGARQEIASRTLVAALRALADDSSVKAVVLRIDSGGGSALASELIWHAVSALKAKKPVVVSMSDVAASGGYYIACGATKIFALADTLTGSIGVVGGKLAPEGALARHGIASFPRGRGKRATMMASLGPWTPDERATVQQMMESIYRVFVGRVAEGRGKKPAEVDAIAQGRVWTGADALRLGLVDELGGLDAALAEATKLGGVGKLADVEVYPGELTLRDVVGSFGEVQSALSPSSALAALAREVSPEAMTVIERALRTVTRFRTSRVQAVALVPALF